MWRRSFSLFVLGLLLSLLLLPLPLATRPPVIEWVAVPLWTVTLNEDERWIRLELQDGSIVILIDGDGSEEDDRHAGIYLRLRDQVFEGEYFGHSAPLVAPERPSGTQTWVSVRASEARVDVTMLDQEPPSPAAPDPYPLHPPYRMEASLHLGDPLVIFLRGLYYLLPTGRPTLSLWNEAGDFAALALPEEGHTRQYFPDLRVIEFTEQAVRYRVETNARLVQFETFPPSADPRPDAFEIDFDHSYKDFGQREIVTWLTIWP